MERKLDQQFRCAPERLVRPFRVSGAGMVAASRKRKSGNNEYRYTICYTKQTATKVSVCDFIGLREGWSSPLDRTSGCMRMSVLPAQ
jgi:hypothetical protein